MGRVEISKFFKSNSYLNHGDLGKLVGNLFLFLFGMYFHSKGIVYIDFGMLMLMLICIREGHEGGQGQGTRVQYVYNVFTGLNRNRLELEEVSQDLRGLFQGKGRGRSGGGSGRGHGTPA